MGQACGADVFLQVLLQVDLVLQYLWMFEAKAGTCFIDSS
jgi:hypothetical protein